MGFAEPLSLPRPFVGLVIAVVTLLPYNYHQRLQVYIQGHVMVFSLDVFHGTFVTIRVRDESANIDGLSSSFANKNYDFSSLEKFFVLFSFQINF